MKKLFYSILMMSVIMMISSCASEEMNARVTKFDKEEVVKKLLGRYFYVEHAYMKIGEETVDLTTDSVFNVYRNAAFIIFHDEYVNWSSGNPQLDPQYPAPAKTFTLLTRIAYPTNMSHRWDDEKGTLEITSGISNYFPMVQAGKKAYLEDMLFYNTFQETQNAEIKEMVKFVLDDIDSQNRAVKYTFVLKPLWRYYREPGQQDYTKFVCY